MTDRDVKKLKRAELLEMLIEQGEENEKLQARIAELEAKLSDRLITVEKAGSIADAAIGLSKVFTEAQDAADRYLESIRQKEKDTEARCSEAEKVTREVCQTRLSKTQTECDQLLAEAKQQNEALKASNQQLQDQIQAAKAELIELDAVKFRMLHPESEPEPAPAPVEEPKPSGWKRLFGKN